ncbi:hypothetical protein AB733_18775 [Photobacterium swingsii]|uniref:Uncharacterized protein n=1 Tax=Photobacterium swingsii TaxID=680026 RepID=A0A0J8V7S2_9GAMM|nr:hypothetical protein [Photobacterium swingsii]KMV29276.1 hypothetical protein AB733_18775 [Photobacterium swingsii]PSW23064.1 hypothetical protein C9I94_17980 [Photobacterium swingsii]
MHELYLENFTPELGIECFQCQQAETQCLLAISEHKIQVHQNTPYNLVQFEYLSVSKYFVSHSLTYPALSN